MHSETFKKTHTKGESYVLILQYASKWVCSDDSKSCRWVTWLFESASSANPLSRFFSSSFKHSSYSM